MKATSTITMKLTKRVRGPSCFYLDALDGARGEIGLRRVVSIRIIRITEIQ